MQAKLPRVVVWRGLADRYRLQAALAPSPGSRLAFSALADCADDVADRIEAGTLVPRAPVPSTATAQHEGPSSPVSGAPDPVRKP
jgi:hypothetical protein